MPLVNKGFFNLTDVVYNRQLGNDWPNVSITAGSTNLASNTTTDLAEGDNLYYTNARVLSYLSETNVDVQDLTVNGNLIVEGTTTTLNTATLVVEDKNIVLANGAINSAAADGAGITIDGASATIAYASTGDKFQINKPLDVNGYSVLTINNTTTNLAEGSNLYYTNARVQAYLESVGVTGIDLSGNTTTDLAEGNNLYYTNARVQAYIDENAIGGIDLSSNTTTDLTEGDNLYYTNTRVQSYLDEIGIAGLDLSSNTTSDLAEGNNLYYTNARVRSAFTPGPGITLSGAGIISSIPQPTDHTAIDDGTHGQLLTNTLSNVFVFPETANPDDRYILKSIQLTNTSDADAYFSANLVLGNTNIQFANLIPLPLGSTTELLSSPQSFISGDAIQMVGYNSSFVPENNVVGIILAYETRVFQPGIFRTANLVTQQDVDVEILDTGESFGIVQSLKLNNLSEEVTRAKVTWKDANDNVISYFTYNLPLPINSSVEVITYPKRLNAGDKVTVSVNSNSLVSAIMSGRYGEQTTIQVYTSSITAGSNSSIIYSSELPDGTSIYYSFE